MTIKTFWVLSLKVYSNSTIIDYFLYLWLEEKAATRPQLSEYSSKESLYPVISVVEMNPFTNTKSNDSVVLGFLALKIFVAAEHVIA